MEKKIGIIGIQGLPASYGAFEQTVDQLTLYASTLGLNLQFFVGCAATAKNVNFSRKNVTRIFTKRKNGALVLVYLLITFLKLYIRGVRTYVFFGYSLSPLFWLFILLGCKVTCNVDGFEWRRAKWGGFAKKYFKFCEYCAAKSGATLIYDSRGVERYYEIHYKRQGVLAFYGGVDLENNIGEFSIANLPVKKTYALCIMRLEPENNIATIIKAFASTPDVRIVIIGPSTSFYANQLSHIVESSPNINYIGPIYDRNKLAFIRDNASFYVHGHSVGGTNPTLLEAVASGNPIVAYRSIFNKEVLKDSSLYFYDVSSLVECIKNAMNFKIAPPKLGECYSWDYVSKQYLDIICGV